ITITTITSAAKNYVEIFFRRKWLFIAPTLISFSLAIAYSFTIPPKYRTSAIVLVEEEKVSNPLISGLAVSTSVQERLQTIVKILLSRPLLEQIIGELGLDKNIPNRPEAYEDLINSLRQSISVQLFGRDILKITAEDRNPVVCQKIANTITTLFIKYNLELQMRETNAGIEFLENQKKIYEQKLKDSEKALREFKERYQGILSVRASEELSNLLGSGAAPLLNTEVLRFTEAKGDLIKLKLDLKEALRRKEQLLKQLKSEGDYVIAEKIVDPVRKQLEQDLAQKQVELARLEIDATEEHPLVRRLKKEIKELQEAIQQKMAQKSATEDKLVLNPLFQNIKMELNKVDREIESLKTKIKLTELYLREESEQIKSIPKKEEELASLQRDYNINAAIYSSLTQKLETAYITKRLELQERGTKFRVVEPASVPLRPFKPNRKFMGFVGLGLGMVIGIGLIFFSEMTDHSFTEINQLRNFLDIPVIGSISQILTVEEAEEIRARRRLWIMALFLFILFSLLGGLIKFIIYKQ
ncbi:MAG: Wzz/FepE/Etk N-terminal domain-containing protein, partial [Candidatus Omnitrophica bacterium]|nr:Wzz/FepE/Etk N-terminal domain-containing protein [Candidatus Omnitrophota bacterium]